MAANSKGNEQEKPGALGEAASKLAAHGFRRKTFRLYGLCERTAHKLFAELLAKGEA
ncbi:hypothetical protein [Paucibacter sp. DJ2R-2]|uniref:hypothetical protein n=1 Tax=Paucibacter sp. DJ2R-2 TaxID=2893558 RepID=UPI0021E3DDC6|nr:hypothetical protein [Paucibacter sp. DJ2R-2]MCV2420442.1 hypothetical protein [Paucibacter sp. DJ4R-1]MCV2439620.1 hypothetical protein [Paucibacter sp. DJ2R-2]